MSGNSYQAKNSPIAPDCQAVRTFSLKQKEEALQAAMAANADCAYVDEQAL